MITQIEALNFRCLRYIKQPLGQFHVLVGPNSSGKTTFLDVISFLGRFVSDGLEAAIQEKTKNFEELIWNRATNHFELAIEARIPGKIKERLGNTYDTVRYEVAIGIADTKEVLILNEKALLKQGKQPLTIQQKELFPSPSIPHGTIFAPKGKLNRTVINKVSGGNDNFYSEVHEGAGKGWTPSFKLGPRKSALGNLPADDSKFPAVTWLKSLLSEGVQPLVLNSALIRKASPPGQVRGFKPDGSNLPWVVAELQNQSPQHFSDWIHHIQTALPDIENIHTVERAEDKHKYMVIEYRGGLKVPSWMVSDGTLRLLALTLPAYIPSLDGIYLIEEPENGIHPRAVETVFQSLSSVYNAQILLATHSPVVLSMVDVDKVLCFAKTPEGATDIVLGSEHPALKEWKQETSLGVLFAAGVLG